MNSSEQDTLNTLNTLKLAILTSLQSSDDKVTLELPDSLARWIYDLTEQTSTTIIHHAIHGNTDAADHVPYVALTIAFYTGYRAGLGGIEIENYRVE